MKPLVYVAGPYTKPDPVENMNRACRIGDRLLEVGVAPVIPHLSGFWHAISPKPYQAWLDLDAEMLLRCDVVFRFPGESSGADAEVALAIDRGIPVVHSVSELLELVDEMRKAGFE